VPFESVPVVDPRAQALLGEYFAFRESTFPAAHGYVVRMPTAGAFAPPDGEFVLATDGDGEAIGCGGIRRLDGGVLPDVAGAVYEVKHLWVRETGRGGGAGRALLTELERRAAAYGAHTVVLDTNVSLTAANRLYASSGYRSIPAYNDNGNATTWYRKDLA
jgi:ribosomal protein S18 acetylase RimI-like enzyme